MRDHCTVSRRYFKFFLLAGGLAAISAIAACSVNPATGQRQFAALMPESQETSVGASEHPKILAEFGGEVKDERLKSYVQSVGQKVTAQTERPDVQYRFFVLDSPVVNAFALPGGYIYTTRGLLALANSEAELAGVLAHETGHITGRHAAERYSRGVLTQLGAAVIASAVESDVAAQAAGLGSELYIRSYSRDQENQADELGLRYMARAGYDTAAMPAFLSSLGSFSSLEARKDGREETGFSYLSTHPQTADRVAQTEAKAAGFPAYGKGYGDREAYLSVIENMIYGDSPENGFVRDGKFLHPLMGFGFTVPEGFNVVNQPSQVVATGAQGAALIFDAARSPSPSDPSAYLVQNWMKGQTAVQPERLVIDGMEAAAANFTGSVNGRPMTIRLVAIQWAPDRFMRFQMGIPQGAHGGTGGVLDASIRSFHRLNEAERKAARPYHVKIVLAGTGQGVATLSSGMPFGELNQYYFRVLNGLRQNENVVTGQRYKVISD